MDQTDFCCIFDTWPSLIKLSFDDQFKFSEIHATEIVGGLATETTVCFRKIFTIKMYALWYTHLEYLIFTIRRSIRLKITYSLHTLSILLKRLLQRENKRPDATELTRIKYFQLITFLRMRDMSLI